MPAATKLVPFVDDVITEAWLAEFSVGWELLEIPIADFNRNASKHNQARADALDSDQVDTYAVAINNGAKFPAIIVVKAGASGYKAIDGNHRYAGALKANATHYMAYVVDDDTPGEVVAAMTMSANTRNGLSVPKSWRVHQALHLTSLGFTDDKAAVLMSVRTSDVKKLRTANSITERAVRLGFSPVVWRDVPDTIKFRLNAIISDVVFQAAMEVAISTQIKTGDQLDSFYSGIKDALVTSEQNALDYINSVATDRRNVARLRAQQGKSALHSPRQSFVTGLGKILKLDRAKINQIFISTDDRDSAVEKIDALIAHAAALRCELKGRTNTANTVMDIAERVENGEI